MMTTESAALLPKKGTSRRPPVVVIDYEAISSNVQVECNNPTNKNNSDAIFVEEEEQTLAGHRDTPRRVLVAVATALTVFVVYAALRPSAVPVASSRGPRPRRDGSGLLTTHVVHQDDTTSYYEVADGTYDIVHGVAVKRVLASGTYVRNAGGNGWHHLTVTAGEGYESSPTAYERSQITSNNYVKAMEAAGYLEGHATCVEMAQYYNNFCTFIPLFPSQQLSPPSSHRLSFLFAVSNRFRAVRRGRPHARHFALHGGEPPVDGHGSGEKLGHERLLAGGERRRRAAGRLAGRGAGRVSGVPTRGG
jgi:hypothetical protein